MTRALEQAIREVGGRLLEWRAAGLTAYRKEGTQFKADADRLAHDALAAHLARLSPETPVVSEEEVASVRAEPAFPYWLVDPIDGTASFVQGFPGFVVQLALMDEAGPVQACVYAPAWDELFTATRGAGAFVNGRALSCGATGRHALIDNYPEPRGIAAEAMDALGFTHYVESGSIGLKICRVADGHADLFVKDVPVRDWDLAPGDLILTEAGGRLTSLHGKPCAYSGRGVHAGVAAAASRDLHGRVVEWASSVTRQLKTT